MQRAVRSVSVLAAVALAGCGSDDEGETAGTTPDGPTTTPAQTCAESFNTDAPVDFARLVRLSHADGAAILTGTFAGDTFVAEAFDDTVDGTGVDATVEPGSCVVTEPSERGTLYVFAVGDDGGWHRFLESDPDVPLSTDPVSQLDGIVEVTLEEGQTSDSPDLVPTGS